MNEMRITLTDYKAPDEANLSSKVAIAEDLYFCRYKDQNFYFLASKKFCYVAGTYNYIYKQDFPWLIRFLKGLSEGEIVRDLNGNYEF